MKYSGLPYTEAERERDSKERMESIRRGYVRGKAAPRGYYSQEPTPALRKIWQRILGESDD